MNQPSQNLVTILGIPFINTTKHQFEKIIHERISNHKNTFVVTANPEIVMYANDHQDYAALIKSADYIIADGIGIVIGAKMLKHPIKERITGYDLFTHLLNWGNQHHKSAYFVGAKPEVIKKLQKAVAEKYPQLTIAGTHDGYFQDDQEIVADIQVQQPDMVFVATGYPKQEQFIQKNRHTTTGLWMGIGGSFDVLTGTVKRAPETWQELHLEWLYRVIKEPSRISRLMVLPKYLLRVLKQRRSKN